MNTIYKYELSLRSNREEVILPIGAKVLSLQAQGDEETPRIWAIVNTKVQERARIVRTFTTGEPIEQEVLNHYDYIGSLQRWGGRFVVHVFLEREKPWA